MYLFSGTKQQQLFVFSEELLCNLSEDSAGVFFASRSLPSKTNQIKSGMRTHLSGGLSQKYRFRGFRKHRMVDFAVL